MNPAEGELTTLAFGWRIERRDGAGVALTSHDRPLVHGGVTYRPAPGMMPAAIKRSGGLEAAAGEVEGAISSQALTEQDLKLGRWDGATMRLIAFDWQGGGDEIALVSGELGSVGISESGFSAELAGAASALDEAVCPTTSSECRARFGGKQCRIDLSARRRIAFVAGHEEHRVTLREAAGPNFVFGTMVVASGDARGWRCSIVGVEGADLLLRDRPRSNLSPGTRLWLTEGCDKRFSTCSTRFANAVNFRGEPHLPGNDLLTRYPGA